MASYKLYRLTFYILGVVLLGSCATLQSEFKEPSVSVTSFRALPSKGMAPRFEIGLHVSNPNRVALALEGLSYSVNIEGRQLLTGVANDLPVIEGYGEGDITLLATADLFNSISLISDLMRQPRDTFNYEINANLDLGGIYPNIPIQKQGQVSLAPVAR
jgi:LEA14-like dessication related protein